MENRFTLDSLGIRPPPPPPTTEGKIGLTLGATNGKWQLISLVAPLRGRANCRIRSLNPRSGRSSRCIQEYGLRVLAAGRAGRTLGQAWPDGGADMVFYSLIERESLWSGLLFSDPEHLLSEPENWLFQFLPSLSSAPGCGSPTLLTLTLCLYPYHVFGSRKRSFPHALVQATKFISCAYSGTFRNPPREPFIHFLAEKSRMCKHCHHLVTQFLQTRVLTESPHLSSH